MKEVLTNPRATAAVMMSGAALAIGLAPAAQAEKPEPAAAAAKETKIAKQARLLSAQLGNRILQMAEFPVLRKKGNCDSTLKYTGKTLAGKPTDPRVRVTCRSGRSLIPGSSDAYRFTASLPGGLHRKPRGSDVNEISMKVGGGPSRRPLAAMNFSRQGRHDWAFNGEYMTKDIDTMVFVNAATNARHPMYRLNAKKLGAIGAQMHQTIDSALTGQPTGLLEPPFQTVSIEDVAIEDAIVIGGYSAATAAQTGN